MSKNEVKFFLTETGFIIGQVSGIKQSKDHEYAYVEYPFRLQMYQEGQVSVQPIFMKEEWIKLYKNSIIGEIPFSDAIYDLYEKYYNKVFSGIIQPESKIIL